MSYVSKIKISDTNGTQITYDLKDARLDSYNLSNFVQKSDLVGVYKYKGSVQNITGLDSIEEKEVGDVYNITTIDMNYAWTGIAWDPLGSTVSVESITNAEIDTMMGS